MVRNGIEASAVKVVPTRRVKKNTYAQILEKW
jgi:hypothetical protein